MTVSPPPYFILTGPPGSGKTTVLEHLAAILSIMPEPARRVLAEERRTGGTATGEQDPAGFVARMLETTRADYDRAKGLTLFDRGLPDLLGFCAHYQLPQAPIREATQHRRYQKTVFFFPAWKEIYQTDEERTLDYAGAAAFGELIRVGYLSSEYHLVDIPKQSPEKRAAFIRSQLSF